MVGIHSWTRLCLYQGAVPRSIASYMSGRYWSCVTPRPVLNASATWGATVTVGTTIWRKPPVKNGNSSSASGSACSGGRW
jgi:hypothetical protein